MKEKEIRPKELIQRYIKLSAKDAECCFSESSRRNLLCVACGSEHE